MLVCVLLLSVRFARSAAVCSRRTAPRAGGGVLLVLALELLQGT